MSELDRAGWHGKILDLCYGTRHDLLPNIFPSCPPTQSVITYHSEIQNIIPYPGCEDLHEHCAFFAGDGQCTNDKVKEWMSENCKKSCNLCGSGGGGGGAGGGGGSGQLLLLSFMS